MVTYYKLIIIFGSYLKQYNFWFFIFCINIGFHLIIKSIFFKFDSACYFGVLLFLLGCFYFYCYYIEISYFYPVFILISFALSSLITFYCFKQPYHFVLSFSLFFVTIGLLFFLINQISIWIFLAIILISVILLIIAYFSL